MTHECENCTEELDTLTAYRLHDCSPADEPGGATDDSPAGGGTEPSESDRNGSRSEAVELDELTDLLENSRDGDHDALYGAVATYQRELRSSR